MFYQNENKESPRQTKPKKGQFMNFSQGHSETKVQCESCLFSSGKSPEFTKMGKIHELFVLPLSLVWFAGATPEKNAHELFCTNFLNTPRAPGHPRQNSRDIPDSSLRNPRKTNFRGRVRTLRPPPLRVEDPNPTGRSPDPKSSSLRSFFLPDLKVWKKDVWDLPALFQTIVELRFSLGNEEKDSENLTADLAWIGSRKRPYNFCT